MEVIQLTVNDIDLLSEVFMIWSAFGVFFGLLWYDFVCWMLSRLVRRFSSRPFNND